MNYEVLLYLLTTHSTLSDWNEQILINKNINATINMIKFVLWLWNMCLLCYIYMIRIECLKYCFVSVCM